MKSFARMALSLFALGIVLFVFALLFSPQVRTAFTSQSGESSIGQLRSDSELKSSGQPNHSTTEPNEGTTQSGSTSRE
jgi:hypothetical protein